VVGVVIYWLELAVGDVDGVVIHWLELAVDDVWTVWYACWNITLKMAAVAAETCW